MNPDLKTPSLHPSLLPRLSFTPISLPPPPERCRGTGNGGYGQFVTRCLCHSLSLRGKTPYTLPLLQREGSSQGRQFSTNFSNVSPSHGLQLFTNFTNFSNLGPSHGVQSFRNRLLQSGTSTGSPALPADLLRRGLLSPRVHRPWQEPASVWGSHRVTASFRRLPALAWYPFHELQVDICSTVDLHALQGDSLPHHGLHHELQGKALCSDISGSSSPPPPSTLTLVSAELFLSHCLTPLSTLLFHHSIFSPLS